MDNNSLESLRKNIRLLGINLRNQDKDFARHGGVSLSQFHILSAINELQSPSMVELADNLSLDKSKVSRVIDVLVNRGLVNRNTNPDNRRYSIISLTPEGEKIIHYVNDMHNNAFRRVLSVLPQEKKEIFIEAFEAFVDAIEKEF